MNQYGFGAYHGFGAFVHPSNLLYSLSHILSITKGNRDHRGKKTTPIDAQERDFRKTNGQAKVSGNDTRYLFLPVIHYICNYALASYGISAYQVWHGLLATE